MSARTAAPVVLLLTLLALTGCGFQLRGADALSATLPQLQLYLQQPDSESARLLRRALQDANVDVTVIEPDTVDLTIPVLVVGAEQITVRPITVTPRARAAQYDVNLTLPVNLVHGEQQLLGPEDLSIQQVYYENTGNITGTLEERETIQTELRRELISRLLRRLEATTAPAAAT